MKPQDQVGVLTQLGFTTNLAKIYLALVQLGPCTAHEISKTANVATEVVYRSMPRLQQMGIVEKIVKSPVEFQATPAEAAVAVLLELKNKENEILRKKSKELITFIKARKKETPIEEYRVVLIPEKRRLTKFVQEKFGEVKNSVDVVTTSKKFSGWIHAHERTFKKTLDNGVTLRFVIAENENETHARILNNVLKHPNLRLKFIPGKIPTCIGIYDDAQVIINTSAESEFAQSPVYWSNSPCLVGLCKNYFENYWKRRTTSTEAAEEHKGHSGRPSTYLLVQ